MQKLYRVMNFLPKSLAFRKPSAINIISQISSKSGTTMAHGLQTNLAFTKIIISGNKAFENRKVFLLKKFFVCNTVRENVGKIITLSARQSAKMRYILLLLYINLLNAKLKTNNKELIVHATKYFHEINMSDISIHNVNKTVSIFLCSFSCK